MTMADRDHEALEPLLAARTAAAAKQARASGGDIPQEELDRLERLAKLITLQKDTAPRKSAGPWPLAGLALATLLVVSTLLFARVRSTEIELDVKATDVGFSLPSQQVLLENVRLSSLGVSGLAGVELPPPLDQLLQAQAAGDDGTALRLMAVESASRVGSISIGALVPARDTDVWLRRGDGAREYRLSLRNPQVVFQVDVVGPVQLSLAGMPPRVHDFVSPRAVVMRPAEGIVDVDLVFLDLARPGVTPQVPVRRLAFSRVDEFADRGLSIVRRLSTIVSGTLYMESLNGDTRQLRSGEPLRFGESIGEIRTVRLEPDHLSLSFHGSVRGMQTGSEDTPRSLMPTWLEWLRARHGLTLLWGTTVYLFGLATAVVRWLKVPL
jgi:hypothetical protein